MEDFHVLLDVGHAEFTPGKQFKNPDTDEVFKEWLFNRQVGKIIYDQLTEKGINCHYVVDPLIKEDTPLSKRVAVVNKLSRQFGKKNCLLLSIHANAFEGNGWTKPKGWSAYTSKGQTQSDKYCDILYEEAEKILPQYGISIRKDFSDGDKDYEENFAMVYKTSCPAILSENCFSTNKTDFDFIMSEEGKEAIAQIHINAILKIIKDYQNR